MKKYFLIAILFTSPAYAVESPNDIQLMEVAKKTFVEHHDNYDGYEKKLHVTDVNDQTITIQIGYQPEGVQDGIPPSVKINWHTNNVVEYDPGCC